MSRKIPIAISLEILPSIDLFAENSNYKFKVQIIQQFIYLFSLNYNISSRLEIDLGFQPLITLFTRSAKDNFIVDQ